MRLYYVKQIKKGIFKMKKSIVLLLCMALCLCMVACGGTNNKKGIGLTVANSPEKAGELFEEAYYTLNYKAHDSLLLAGGEDFYQYLAIKESKDAEEIYKNLSSDEASNYNEYCKYMDNETEEHLERRYGDSIEFTIKDSTARKLYSEQFDEIKELFKGTYSDFIDAEKITEGYKVEVTYTVKGSVKKETRTSAHTVVKYKGEYKIFDGLGG